MPSFEYYSGVTDPIQQLHQYQDLRQYQDKMVVHSHDDILLNRVFPSSLKGTTTQFYSLPRHSLQSFKEVK